jgi:hypothetical protein
MSLPLDPVAAGDALQAFAKLNRADQSAIARRLGPQERRLLLAFEREQTLAKREPPLPDWSAYSPQLARHMLRLVSDAAAGASKLAPRAQAALHECLSSPDGVRP